MEVENINSREKLVISSSRTTRYLGYPRKVPLWELEFILPEECKLIRNNDNSDISLEIENCKGKAFVPALSKKESIIRLRTLIPELKTIYRFLRVWKSVKNIKCLLN